MLLIYCLDLADQAASHTAFSHALSSDTANAAGSSSAILGRRGGLAARIAT
eukprot:COSAG06_NODE_522_length_14708_cov_276.456773_10_plen_51_part_00